MIREIAELLRPINRKIANVVSRGIVRMVTDYSGLQVLQVDLLSGETRGEIERVQNYGFASVPEDGAQALVVFMNGNRNSGFAVAVEDGDSRPSDLDPGEACVYHKDGARITMKANGDISIDAKSGSEIIMNGGSAKVARVGDKTAGHIHSFKLKDSLNGVVTGTIESNTDTIAEGADKVKA